MTISLQLEADFRELDNAGRYSRQEQIPGWSQEVVAQAQILVVGAGALGNEVLKNLALLGAGQLTIVDFDRVELSNLSRSVLFSDADIGEFKAVAAAKRLRLINPELRVTSVVADITAEIGAGELGRHDLVLGCLDNIAARWKLNRLCRSAGVTWIDGGIDAVCGQVSFFAPNDGPCYECGMTASMWRRMNERRSCMLAARTTPEAPVAVNSVLASMTAALQVQEVLAFLHRKSHMSRMADYWHGLYPGQKLAARVQPYEMAVLESKRRADCLAHDEYQGRLKLDVAPADLTARELLVATGSVGLRLDWDLLICLECVACGRDEVAMPAWHLREADLQCRRCGRHRLPEWGCLVEPDSSAALLSLAEIGVPFEAHLQLVRDDGGSILCELTRRRART